MLVAPERCEVTGVACDLAELTPRNGRAWIADSGLATARRCGAYQRYLYVVLARKYRHNL